MFVLAMVDDELVLLDLSLPWPTEEKTFTDTEALKFAQESKARFFCRLKEMGVSFFEMPYMLQQEINNVETVKCRMDDYIKQRGREW
jgi:hypothetical protein